MNQEHKQQEEQFTIKSINGGVLYLDHMYHPEGDRITDNIHLSRYLAATDFWIINAYMNALDVSKSFIGCPTSSPSTYIFEGCHFERCQFTDSTIKDCSFMKCTFNNCDFTNTQFEDCGFSTTCEFIDCCMRGAVFHTIIGAAPKGLWFSGPDSRGKNVFTWMSDGDLYFNFGEATFKSIEDIRNTLTGSYAAECCARAELLITLMEGEF